MTVARNHRCRIVLTGGPGGGKTTAADLFRRELGERVVVVPEAATMLFSGGFPRVDDIDARRAAQVAIYHVQRNLEDVQSASYRDRVLLCDRGTIDGSVYWPDGGFFETLGTSIEAELGRYDAVVFFESAAAGGIDIEGGNPSRVESIDEALALDRALREVYSAHPRFTLIPHRKSFIEKVNEGVITLKRLIAELATPASPKGRPMSHLDDPVSSIATMNVATVVPSAPLSEVHDLLEGHTLHHVPVVVDGRLVGLISASDVLRAAFGAFLGDHFSMRERLAQLSARDVMVEDLITIQKDEPIRRAAELLSSGAFHALPVLDGERVAGIVTSTDLIRQLRQTE